MLRRHAPWWTYIVTVSFLGYFALQIYTSWFGSVSVLGFTPDYSGGRMVVVSVFQDSPGERAGLRAGDRIVAVNRAPIHGQVDWNVFRTTWGIGRPFRMEVERGGQRIELTPTFARTSLALPIRDAPWHAAELITLVLAFVIAFRRPRDLGAWIGAWFLVTSGILLFSWSLAFTSTWGHLPAPLGLLLWIPTVCLNLFPGISFTFFAVFPRTLFRARWAWGLLWTPVLLVTAWRLPFQYTLVYHSDTLASRSGTDQVFFVVALVYGLAGLAVLVVQYRRLEDLNERRRLRVLVVGSLVGWLGVATNFALLLSGGRAAAAFFGSPLPVVTFSLYLAFPLSFAYAILRHRVFELGLIVRRGLQYVLARRLLLSAVPVLSAVLLLDFLLHGDQPILAVLRVRGWMYAALAALAAIAYTQRQKWLEVLDRRFFRERYDAQRLLREVVEEARAAQNFDGMAPRVVARIEAALHPEFVALLVRKSREPAYRTVAAAPPEYVQPVLPAESKLMGLVRLLGKPLEVPHSESGWLQQQLPHEETELLRRARIDLLVPVATAPDCPEALLLLGAKRSEEPYSGEDQDLLVTIAASLAILLEKPPPSLAPRRNVFEECPDCGSCYDPGTTRCARDAAELRPATLPRLLEGRYRMDRRLGRGGMGTVYETTDTALERRVAVKVVREDLVGSAEAAERFRREALAAASFAHPNVVTVYDYGLAAGTRAFLVMELLQGSTLREGLQGQRPFSAARALLIMRDVCAALEAAHRRQLVHRDLKPENIFLVANESGETAKLLDFGLAKFLSAATQDLTADTAPGAVLGTLRYMSPEQWRGEEAHPSWDLWALAVVAYEMLTGAYPFCGNSPVDWFGNGNGARVTPVAAHLPEAPRSCQELFERTFAQDAAQRPQAARTFFSELQSALS